AATARVPRTRTACTRQARRTSGSRRDTNELHALRDNARKSVNETSTLWADRRRVRRSWLRSPIAAVPALIRRRLSDHIPPFREGSDDIRNSVRPHGDAVCRRADRGSGLMLQALELARRIEAGELSPADVVDLCAKAIDASEKDVCAFVALDVARAKDRA